MCSLLIFIEIILVAYINKKNCSAFDYQFIFLITVYYVYVYLFML